MAERLSRTRSALNRASDFGAMRQIAMNGVPLSHSYNFAALQ
jgi:hypothetical protein